jgi:hypothetical protein
LLAAKQFESLGFLGAANQLYDKLQNTGSGEGADQARYLQRRMLRKIERQTSDGVPWHLVCHRASSNPHFIRSLLKNVNYNIVYDEKKDFFSAKMIIFSEVSDIGKDLLEFCKEAFYKGISLAVVCGDEWYKDDSGFYAEVQQYADCLIMRYFWDIFQNDASVIYCPLGWFHPEFVTCDHQGGCRHVLHRKHMWSFVGDIKKFSRQAMFENMSKVENGYNHLTAGWQTPDHLGPAEYRMVLEDTVFAPCPAGWANLETFRVWEALEAGCIPIVEKRPYFDYFTLAVGKHPMPSVEAWDEAAGFIRSIGDMDRLEELRQSCHDWWKSYKDRLGERITAALSAL